MQGSKQHDAGKVSRRRPEGRGAYGTKRRRLLTTNRFFYGAGLISTEEYDGLMGMMV